MIGGLVPTWVEGCKSNPAVFGIANAFAAGVFLAIALLHMLPEEIDDWKFKYEKMKKVASSEKRRRVENLRVHSAQLACAKQEANMFRAMSFGNNFSNKWALCATKS